ncbi:hypothetical protein K2X33_05100, partial [bacterium]|nr:hypothetical protein [bacterium]
MKHVWNVFLMATLALPVAAEWNTNSSTATSAGNAIGSQGAADPFAVSGGNAANPGGGFFSNTGNIVDNATNNSGNGREYKLGDAERQAGAGTAAAISAGSLLTAAGVRELAALNFGAAARYFGMAGTEFAQAAATSEKGADYNEQRSALLNVDGDVGFQAYNQADVASNILTDEARQALASQGINPDNFANQLASGSIRTGTDALGALGQDVASYSPDEMKWVNDYSGVDLAGMKAAAEGDASAADRQQLATDDSAKGGGGGGAAGGAAAGAGAGGKSEMEDMKGPRLAGKGGKAAPDAKTTGGR